MSILRWIGLGVGAAMFLYVFFLARRGRSRGLDSIIGMLAGLGLMGISAYPDAISIVRDMLSLEKDQFSRLIAVGIISNILLWILIVRARLQFTEQADLLDTLVRRLAVKDFESMYPELEPLTPIVVLIPAYNEQDSIKGVLDKIPESIGGMKVTVIVIDDGSDDDTAAAVREAGFPAVKCAINRGQGAALHVGFDIVKRFGAQIVVTMDADGQHMPEDMEKLVGPIADDEADFVIGSRILGDREKDSATRYVGIHVFNSIIRVLTPIKVTDCSNGYRALRVSTLAKLVLRQAQYQAPEVIIEAARKGARIGEAPVTVKQRTSGTSKKGRNLKYALYFARSIYKTWLR